MLTRLSVRNLVAIPHVEVDFAPGLTVITGESGAGKSVLLGGLDLALGARASSDFIGHAASRAEAQAEFRADPGSEAAVYMAELELADVDDPAYCITRRTLDREGRSRAFVNDTGVSRQTLAGLGERLVDIQAQHGSVRLSRPEVQRAVFDDYAGAGKNLAETADAFRAWRDAVKELEAQERWGSDESRELLDFQLAELDELDPRTDEYEEVEVEHRRLADSEHRRETVAQAIESLNELDSLRSAAVQLDRVDDPEPTLDAARRNLDVALSMMGDAAVELHRYAERLAPDPQRLRWLEERLGRMLDVARKHRVPPEELPALRLSKRAAVEAWASASEREAEAKLRVAELESRYREAALALRNRRECAIKAFCGEVEAHLCALGLKQARLQVRLSESSSPRAQGLERVDFLISTHPDNPAGPLGQVASGGERARIALAIAIAAAERSALPCLVLDEADIGVGGVSADSIGRILKGVARSTQVICVTHAPQVAALGEHHLCAERSDDGGVALQCLDQEARVEEIARMLSGSSITRKARDHARELLEEGRDAAARHRSDRIRGKGTRK